MTDIADELVADRRSSKPGELPDDMPRWMAIPITYIDWFSYWIGMTVCWFTVPLFSAMVYEVIARYAFTAPTMSPRVGRTSTGANSKTVGMPTSSGFSTGKKPWAGFLPTPSLRRARKKCQPGRT